MTDAPYGSAYVLCEKGVTREVSVPQNVSWVFLTTYPPGRHGAIRVATRFSSCLFIPVHDRP
jgi:hypothetical protein